LNKNEKIKNLYDDWGNRCYLFTAEYGTEFIDGKDKRKTKNTEINNLEINTDVLKEMGCLYIFSANKINNFESNNLTFEKMFTGRSSYWKIYLYKIEK
jgi:lipoteichoic acid galactosyltransferase